jgi:hypothetical protein
MQFLGRVEMEAIAAAMQRMSQLKLPIAVVGTGLPQLPGLMVEAKSYAERLFSYPQVGPLSEQAAREASAPIVQTKLDEEFFHVRFEKATPRERVYMAAMADLGDGPYRSSDVAERMASRPSTASSLRDALIKKGLIFSPDHGAVDFTVPHFSPFMRRRYPLKAVAGDAPAGRSER